MNGHLAISFFLGIGFGAYSAVDFALVMDVLPAEKDKAKDLAVWHQVTIMIDILPIYPHMSLYNNNNNNEFILIWLVRSYIQYNQRFKNTIIALLRPTT